NMALSLLAGTWDLLVALDCLGEMHEFLPDLVRLAMDAGDVGRAAAATETADRLAARARTPGSRATATRCRGILERDPDALRQATGWESLTVTELEVARLVAEGLTNPEIGARLFISKRTAGTHLSHIFSKLDISSRVQLASEMAARSSREPAPAASDSGSVR